MDARISSVKHLADDEMRAIRGGRSFWGAVKGAATWVKNHVVAGLHSIGIKGTF